MKELFNYNEENVDEAGNIIQYILIATYSLLFIILCISMIHALLRMRNGIVKMLKCLLPWPILARDIDLILHINDDYLTDPISTQDVATIFTSGAAGYLLFSVFLLLVLFWAYLYHSSSARIETFVKRLLLTYILINTIVYGIWFILLSLMAIYKNEINEIHEAEAVYAASLNILVGLSFFIYGACLLNVLTNNQQINFITRRIFLLTSFCTLIFVVRSFWILINQFYFDSSLVNLFGATVNDVFFELMPITFILIVLSWPTHSIAIKNITQKKESQLQKLYSPGNSV